MGYVFVRSHAPVGVWVALGMVYLLLYGLFPLTARAHARAVTSARVAVPDALLVRMAMDRSVLPRRNRLLIADQDGLRLVRSRRRLYESAWQLGWGEILGAELGLLRCRSGTRTGVVVHVIGGKTKTFGLPSKYAITNPLPLADEAVRIINEHTSAGTPLLYGHKRGHVPR